MPFDTFRECTASHSAESPLLTREWLLLCLCARLGRVTVLDVDEYPRAAAARL